MAEFDLTTQGTEVTFKPATVEFPAYEEYREKAMIVADHIGSMVVTADTVKETKKTLANARKLTDRLNRVRIDLKKALLTEYTTFEAQVKEITSIIDSADADLRAKVKALEEQERDEKAEEIRAIWDKRVAQWPMIEEVLPGAFKLWLTPKHLNKTTSMKMIEADMTEWITKTAQDIETAAKMGNEYLVAYSKSANLAQAISEVEWEKELGGRLKKMASEEVESIPAATFTVYGRKDIAFTERLLKENDITFDKKEI